MKIKYLTTKLNLIKGGGANRAIDLMVRSLIQNGHEVKVVTAFSKSNAFENLSYEVLQENMTSTHPRKNIAEIVAVLKKYEDDTDVYILDAHFFMWGAAYYKKTGGKSKVVAYIFSFLESMNLFSEAGRPMNIRRAVGLFVQKLWEMFIAKKNLKFIDWFIYQSPVNILPFKKFGLPNAKSTMICPFVEIRPEAGEPTPEFRLLFVGRFVLYKGVETLVKAMKLLPKEIKLDLVGDGEEEPNLRKIADDRVTFHGFKNRDELAEFYKHASLLVHPTLDPEPFGLIIVEGMNYGLPSVSSEGSGSAWVSGEAGITFKAGDENDLSAKILLIYNDAALRNNLREKAVERVKYFDYKNWLPKLEEVLKKI